MSSRHSSQESEYEFPFPQHQPYKLKNGDTLTIKGTFALPNNPEEIMVEVCFFTNRCNAFLNGSLPIDQVNEILKNNHDPLQQLLNI